MTDFTNYVPTPPETAIIFTNRMVPTANELAAIAVQVAVPRVVTVMNSRLMGVSESIPDADHIEGYLPSNLTANGTTIVQNKFNAPTVATPVGVNVDEQEGVASSGIAVDIDPPNAEDLIYTATGLPSGMSIDADTGAITGTPAASSSSGGPGENGVYSVVVTATVDDQWAEFITDSFTITVAAP